MTKLEVGDSVRRETKVEYRGVPLIAELGSHCITMRLKGERGGYSVPYDAVFELGGKLHARAARIEKGK